MDEIGLAQKFFNLILLMGGMFAFFYALISGTLRLGVVVLGRLVHRPGDDASFFDGTGMDQPGPSPLPSRHRSVNPITNHVRITTR